MVKKTMKKKDLVIKPTKMEANFVVGLLKSYESELQSSKAIGMKVPDSEQRLVSSLSDKFQMFI